MFLEACSSLDPHCRLFHMPRSHILVRYDDIHCTQQVECAPVSPLLLPYFDIVCTRPTRLMWVNNSSNSSSQFRFRPDVPALLARMDIDTVA